MKQCNKTNRKIPSLIVLLLFCCLSASAQSFLTKGVVVDSNGEPVIGAAVALKGNETVGVITDLDGRFSMTVDQNAVLVVSFIGMETVEVPASKSEMRIVLNNTCINYVQIIKKVCKGTINMVKMKVFCQKIMQYRFFFVPL